MLRISVSYVYADFWYSTVGTYPASGTLSNSRHCAFLLARVLAGIDVGRRLSVLGGWWFSSSANFGGGLPMQRNGFCDWQSRGIGEDCTYWKIQAGHEDEPQAVRQTVARTENLIGNFASKPHNGFSCVVDWWVGVQLQAKSFSRCILASKSPAVCGTLPRF
jgi:hypothetical protein